MAVLVLSDIATQAAAGFVQGLRPGQAHHGFVEVQHALAGGQFGQLVARAFRGLRGGRLGVVELGHDAVEAGGAHQAPIDFARGLRALAPGPNDRRYLLHGGIAVVIAALVEGVAEVNLGDSEVLIMFLVVIAAGYLALEKSLSTVP